MKASELRIGNYINYGESGSVKIDSITALTNVFNDLEFKFPHSKPIPLTEEWLLKFKFNRRRLDGNRWLEKKHKGILLLTNDFNKIKGEAFATKIKFVFLHDYGPEVKAKYVHQLQNLYFALTGEELK